MRGEKFQKVQYDPISIKHKRVIGYIVAHQHYDNKVALTA